MYVTCEWVGGCKLRKNKWKVVNNHSSCNKSNYNQIVGTPCVACRLNSKIIIHWKLGESEREGERERLCVYSMQFCGLPFKHLLLAGLDLILLPNHNPKQFSSWQIRFAYTGASLLVVLYINDVVEGRHWFRFISTLIPIHNQNYK